jgi:hypothetical protein
LLPGHVLLAFDHHAEIHARMLSASAARVR